MPDGWCVATSLTISDFCWLPCVLHTVSSGASCPKTTEIRRQTVQGSKLKAGLFQCMVMVVIKRFTQNKVINQNMSLVSFRHDKWSFLDLRRQTAIWTCER